MSLSTNDIDQIVDLVTQKLKNKPRKKSIPDSTTGIFRSLDDAVAAATEAQKKIRNLDFRSIIIRSIREAGDRHAKEFAEMAVKETGMGRVEDKIQKNRSQALKTPGLEDLKPEALTGDHGLTLIEKAAWGVIASVTPSTNPAATIINNAISMISAGNAVVFAPHPGAKNVSLRTIKTLNEAILAAGGPPTLLTTTEDPSIEVAQNLFTYPGINLLVVTGGEGVVKAARQVTDKRLMAAGAGNPPVVVDDSADIKKAAKSIITGASFDNNIVCVDEKEIIAVDSIADSLKYEFSGQGAVELDSQQAEALAGVILETSQSSKPEVNRKWVGRNAALLAAEIGLKVPDETRLLFTETDKDHPFARLELMMPVIPLVRAGSAMEAISMAVELERGLSHTAAMHSRNIEHLDEMANQINTSIFVKNGPCLAGVGVGGEGWTSMTITTPTGEGVTSARSFVRLRRCVVVDQFRIV